MESNKSISKEFESVYVENPKDKSSILFKDLWEKSERPLILIHWLRRFGWSLCMMGAADLSASVKKINEENNNILDYATIGLSYLDYNIFEENNYVENGKIYIDEKKNSYKLMNFSSLGFFSGYGMMNPMVYIRAMAAKARGFIGNMQGDGFQLGGTVIIDRLGNIIFTHKQSNYTDYPKEEALVKAANDYKVKNNL